ERGAPARRGFAIPPAIGQLLAEKSIQQPFARLSEVGARRQDAPVDTGLRLALEIGSAVELMPGDVPSHPFDGSADLSGRRVHPQILEQREMVDGDHPTPVLTPAPVA